MNKDIITQNISGLKRKERMMIRKRVATKRKPKIWLLVVVAALLIAFVIGYRHVVPIHAGTAYVPDSDKALTMDFVGDVMLGRNIRTDGTVHGYEKYYKYVSPYWQNADLAFANIESTVLENGKSYTQAKKTRRSIYLAADYEGLDSLMDAGINMLACANNHAGDYGKKPIGEICEYLDALSGTVTYAGIGRDIDEAASFKVVEKNGIKIGFVSITETFYSNAAAKFQQEGVFTTLYSSFNRVVGDASKVSDIVVVYIHFGEENQSRSNDTQKTYAHHLIEAGADIVIGSHPHVLQDVELYNGGIIFYSLGNFIFDQGNTYSRDSVMVQYTLDKDGSGEFELIPIRVNEGVPGETFMRLYTARINRELTQNLEEGAYYYNDDGHVVIPAVNINISDTKPTGTVMPPNGFANDNNED